jgi:hypothetical protein
MSVSISSWITDFMREAVNGRHMGGNDARYTSLNASIDGGLMMSRMEIIWQLVSIPRNERWPVVEDTHVLTDTSLTEEFEQLELS